MGHDGATAGTLDNPTGPIVDLADALTGVDAVIGDHTNFQVSRRGRTASSSTENLSKGVRFTRVRLLVDTRTKEVVYKTADFHKPWNIGVTPDPAIQARIDALNEELKPILGTVIGASTVEVPAPTPAVASTAVSASRWSATSSPTPCGRPSGPTSPSRTQVASGRPHVPARRGAATALPELHPAAVADHAWTGAGSAPVREHRRHPRRQRRRAEDDAGERRLADAGGRRPLPAGLRALLHLRHLGPGGEPGHRRGAAGGGRELHGSAGRPDRRPRCTTSPRTTSWSPAATGMQRQVLLGDVYLTGVSHLRRFLSLPATTSKNAFWIALVTGPALPSPMVRPVELADRRDLGRGAGKERFVRDVDVVAREALGAHWVTELCGELDHRGARDAGERGGELRLPENAIFDDKDVLARASATKPSTSRSRPSS